MRSILRNNNKYIPILSNSSAYKGFVSFDEEAATDGFFVSIGTSVFLLELLFPPTKRYKHIRAKITRRKDLPYLRLYSSHSIWRSFIAPPRNEAFSTDLLKRYGNTSETGPKGKYL